MTWEIKVHCVVPMLPDKHTLQYVATLNASNASRLPIGKKIGAGVVDCVAVSSATTGVPKVLLVDVVGLGVNPRCTAITPDF